MKKKGKNIMKDNYDFDNAVIKDYSTDIILRDNSFSRVF